MIMTLDLKSEVSRILERHIGRENPIKAMDLAKMLGLKDDREIRLIIRELIAEGMPVVSRTDSQAGYFIAQSFSEIEEYKRVTRSRLINDATRIRDVRRAFQNYWNGNKQIRLV